MVGNGKECGSGRDKMWLGRRKNVVQDGIKWDLERERMWFGTG